jgi:tRNA A37 methylthiotransferase MiaB
MSSAIRKITCIQLRAEFPDFCFRLVMPDYGMPLIGTILSEAGYDVRVYMEHIKAPEWERLAESDLVCCSAMSAAADKTRALAMEIKSRLDIPVVIGGTHATYFVESCLEFADYVVLGEGDETIIELVDALAEGRDVSNVPGIAYRHGDRIVRNEAIPNFELIAGLNRLGFVQRALYRKRPLMPVQTSRGCLFKCTFCIVNTMFPAGYRKREIESVIQDLRNKRQYAKRILMVDNEFALLPPYTKRLLRRIIEEDLDLDIGVLTRVDVAKDDELLRLMREAGVTQIFQGYESVQPETLVDYDKHQTIERIGAAVDKLNSYGFRLSGSFVVGADTDTAETLNCTVEFVNDRKLTNAYFFPIWGHYPEQFRGYRTILPWHRSLFLGWKYCDGHFVTHFPKRMRPSELQRAVIDAYRGVYSPTQIVRALRRGQYAVAKEKLLHRFMWSIIEKGPVKVLPVLEEIEDGLYDDRGNLQEDLLIERVRQDPPWVFREGNRALENLGISPPELLVLGQQITCVTNPA